MNRFRMTKLYAAGSVILPAAAVLIWHSQLWVIAVFLAWFLAAALLWIWCDRKEQGQRLARTVHAMQTSSIATLNHHRHDWMNELQVLYGYIRMGKEDKMVVCVEQIRERMTAESRIARLGIPSLVAYLQSFRTMTHAMELDVEIEGELSLAGLPLDGEQTGEAIIDIINAYRLGTKQGAGDVAKLSVDFVLGDHSLDVTFHYDGELNDASDWKQKCKRALKGSPFKAVELEQPANIILEAKLGN
ncbi:Spo0B domain-containing protein [Paenibacillus oenotherae]|uniref:Spo0B domain-containing protein n=1 Tax=Paenibacillus oenotherae TaxID=1435645 RepID=A0ABS7D8W8_9BACL|nr:Spo0B domain-containing protein [Paenibacillus oenotherae]MBW7476229.1 Spo0B domain-containing protein [Paenibacillus oenotherae]